MQFKELNPVRDYPDTKYTNTRYRGGTDNVLTDTDNVQ